MVFGLATRVLKSKLLKYAKDGATTQEWCHVVSRAEKTVGGPTSFDPRWLQDDLAGTANHLQKLVETNPLLKSVKKQLTSSKRKLQRGLIILLVSKMAGFDTKSFTKNQYDSGILHSQRALAKILEMQCTSHRIHQSIVNLQEKKKLGDNYQQLLNGNKILLLLGDVILARTLLNYGDVGNNDVFELVSSGLRDQIEGEFLGEHGADNHPMPSKPNVGHELKPYDWESEYNLEKLGSNSYLGQGKDEWVLRTMLQSGSILGKGCQAAMKLARRGEEMERNAYILGGHLALIWQLYFDIKDFFTNRSYSLVSAPVIMALWEYPSIYDHLLSQRPLCLKELSYAVCSTRCLDVLSSLLDEELASILKYSDRLPVNDARNALHNIAWTIYREAVKIIEHEIKKHNQ
ncbi:all trans-polyprenyl-diphosphate synthase PDSS2-like isoform X2 [Cydia pomonella]|uniref:all trans-polyprenyl-diphosphate synthase PDSS2-like isoform X2 n=1 Tax=Cydia pomonella TaxID=82600 RepID=UPI002ADD797C|nr:all trans-polyprenyl-diphosphate synthase PDSS2-like isoform X2 [Cydia pomonella]